MTVKNSRRKVYNSLALYTLLYGSETWAMREQDKGIGKEIYENGKFTQDYKTNADILSELKINSVVKKIQNYINK